MQRVKVGREIEGETRVKKYREAWHAYRSEKLRERERE